MCVCVCGRLLLPGCERSNAAFPTELSYKSVCEAIQMGSVGYLALWDIVGDVGRKKDEIRKGEKIGCSSSYFRPFRL